RHRTEDVRLEHLADFRHLRALQHIQHADASIVDQSINWPYGFDGLSDAVWARDIQWEDFEPVVRGEEVVSRRAHGRHHVPPSLQEFLRDGETETGQATGDEDSWHIPSPENQLA